MNFRQRLARIWQVLVLLLLTLAVDAALFWIAFAGLVSSNRGLVMAGLVFSNIVVVLVALRLKALGIM